MGRIIKEIDFLREKNEELEAENTQLRGELSEFQACVPDIKAEIKQLREALIFYEDPCGSQLNEGCTPSEIQVPDFYDEMDFGARARAALERGE